MLSRPLAPHAAPEPRSRHKGHATGTTARAPAPTPLLVFMSLLACTLPCTTHSALHYPSFAIKQNNALATMAGSGAGAGGGTATKATKASSIVRGTDFLRYRFITGMVCTKRSGFSLEPCEA